ncbi:hypothetical protein GGI12_000313 [Dipsacomyces acuminosporus]|nr:hypothetical protein GGI12_000313 [Dipsacomyces acuminosporus]
MDTTKLQTLVKPLLRSVLLKVHPDFFASDPVAKRVNQGSIQQLQDLLSPVLASTSKTERRAIPPLEFVCRNGDSLETVRFAFKDSRTRSEQQLCAQRTRDFLALCTRLKVEMPSEALKEIEQVVRQMEAGATSSRIGRAAGSAAAAESIEQLRAARAREARQNYRRSQAASDPYAAFTEKLRQSSWMPNTQGGKRAEARLDRSKVFFAQDVNPSKYLSIVGFIESHLHELSYSSWCSLPLMVVNDWKDAFRQHRPAYPGFVVVPRQFTVPEFRRYLVENLSDIQNERTKRNARWL